MFLISFELIALAVPDWFSQFMNLPVSLVVLNASFSHILFIALSPAGFKSSIRLLSFDIALFVVVTVGMICSLLN